MTRVVGIDLFDLFVQYEVSHLEMQSPATVQYETVDSVDSVDKTGHATMSHFSIHKPDGLIDLAPFRPFRESNQIDSAALRSHEYH